MDKPAFIVLKFDKVQEGYWKAFLDLVDKKTFQESDNAVFAYIEVKSYNLADHQFIQVRVDMGGGKEQTVLIPRGMVMTILEGKGDVGKSLYFAGGGGKQDKR